MLFSALMIRRLTNGSNYGCSGKPSILYVPSASLDYCLNQYCVSTSVSSEASEKSD